MPRPTIIWPSRQTPSPKGEKASIIPPASADKSTAFLLCKPVVGSDIR